MQNFDFDEFITREEKVENKVEETKVEKVEESKVDEKKIEEPKQQQFNNQKNNANNNGNNKVVAKSASLQLTEKMLARIEELTTATGEILSAKDKAIASDITINALQSIKKAGYGLQQIDFVGNNIESQIKRWARLGIDTNDFLYTSLRKNGKTGLVDIKIEPQYQTLEKLIILYCTKNIFRFKTDIICTGDEFKTDFDFATGQDIVLKHVKNENIDRNDLTNIIGAYKIAYVKEKDGSITQLLVQIDLVRIMRAFNSAKTKDIWNADTIKMVLKTVTWEMWRSEVIRPFMKFPDYIINDLSIVDENSDVDFDNKDFKHKNIVDAEVHAKESIGTGDGLDF